MADNKQPTRGFHLRSRQLSLLTLVLMTMAPQVEAQVVNRTIYVCFSFAGSGLNTPEQKAEFLQKTQQFFATAGPPVLSGGSGVNLQVRVVEMTSGNPLKGKLADGTTIVDGQIASAFRSLPGEDLAGRAFKENHRCFVDAAKINQMFPGRQNLARRCRMAAEILAHEIGHMLCATHQCLGTSSRKTCTGEPTILSIGTCIPKEKLGNNPSSLRINSISAKQIVRGIKAWDKAIKAGTRPNWELKAAYFQGAVGLVNGITYLDPVPSGDGDVNFPLCGLNSFHYDLTGRTDLFQFGWLNEDGDFVEPLPLGDNPDRVLEGHSGTLMNFAIRGWENSPFPDQVFTQEDYGTVTLHGSVRIPSQSATPEVTTDYFSRAQIDFNDIPGLAPGTAFTIDLNSEDFSDDNGFYVADAPTSLGACCIPDGSCEDNVRPEECDVFSGFYQGDATTCALASCPEVGQILINDPGPSTVGQVSFLDLTVLDQVSSPLANAQIVVTSENADVLFLGGQPYPDGTGATVQTDGFGQTSMPFIPAAPGQVTLSADVSGSLVTDSVSVLVNDLPPAVRADADMDSDVDGIDFGRFATCFNGAGKVPRIPDCNAQEIARFDFDGDGDIDGLDFSEFASCFNQAGNPPRCPGSIAAP